MANNLKKIRNRLGWTQDQAAAAMGTTKNQLIKLEKGDRRLSEQWIDRAAAAYSVDPGEVVSESPTNAVKVVGRIGAGAEILPEFEQDQGEHATLVEVPVTIPKDAVAFEIIGDSMLPRYDPGDIIICWKHGDARSMVDGWEAAVMTEDGRRFLKKVRRVGEDRFDLESHNASPIRDVRLEWVMKVGATVKAGEWRPVEPIKTPRRQKADSRRPAEKPGSNDQI